MERICSVVLVLLFSLTAASASTPVPGKLYGPYYGDSLKRVVVVIDPGHGGTDPGCHWLFQKQDFWEAAYTYKMAAELGEMVRRHGGSIVYTATSSVMTKRTNPRVAMPLPRDAKLANGKTVTARLSSLNARAAVATGTYKKCKGKFSLMIFFSLHIDAMGKIWKGEHVLYDRGTNSAPRIGKLVSQAMCDFGYQRQKIAKYTKVKGKKRPVYKTVEPLDRHPSKRLRVIDGRYNILRHRVLVECGIPGNAGDSWRLRNEMNRKLMMERCLLKSAIKLAKERRTHALSPIGRPQGRLFLNFKNP